MSTKSPPPQLHWNGLITYHPDFRSDGALKSAVGDWKRGKNLVVGKTAESESEDEELEALLMSRGNLKKKRKMATGR